MGKANEMNLYSRLDIIDMTCDNFQSLKIYSHYLYIINKRICLYDGLWPLRVQSLTSSFIFGFHFTRNISCEVLKKTRNALSKVRATLKLPCLSYILCRNISHSYKLYSWWWRRAFWIEKQETAAAFYTPVAAFYTPEMTNCHVKATQVKK